MPTVRFSTELVPDSGYTFIYFPRALLGAKGRVRVKGTINGHPFTTSAQPGREGQYIISVNAETRRLLNVVPGEKVEVVLEPSTEPAPEPAVPLDLVKALHGREGAEDAFAKLPPSHRKRYIEWVAGAKRPQTRASRVTRTVAMALAGVDPFHPR